MHAGSADEIISRFLQVFRAAARQAGAMARHLQGEVRDLGKTGHSAESSALSAVDLAAQDVLLYRLAESLAHVAVDTEEDTEAVSLFPPESPGAPVMVIDPIDGSLSYLRGSRDYAVMGALAAGGSYRAAAIHFPARDVTVWAASSVGCFRVRGRGEPERVHMRHLPDLVLVPPRTPEPVRARIGELGYEVELSRCSAVDASAPALGRATGSANVRPPDRRRAIGFLLVTEAGGSVQFSDRPWRGEDPDAEGAPDGAHALADTPERARALLDAALAADRG